MCQFAVHATVAEQDSYFFRYPDPVKTFFLAVNKRHDVAGVSLTYHVWLSQTLAVSDNFAFRKSSRHISRKTKTEGVKKILG